MRRIIPLSFVAAPLVVLTACESRTPSEAGTTPAAIGASYSRSGEQGSDANAARRSTVVATGLTNPRGIAFGDNGAIYVAEAGLGGPVTTVGQCQQVAPPPLGPGPFLSGRTGRISRIDARGNRTTVVDRLPSSANSLPSHDVVGVADLAFIGRTLYALLDAGCGHGVPDVPAGVFRIHDGTFTQVANLTAFVHANPVHFMDTDFEPDGDWYSMIASRGVLYAMDANGGQLVRVNPSTGAVHRIIDISLTENHIVPTTVTTDGNVFFVGNLGEFPSTQSSKVFRITPDGQKTTVAQGFPPILGLAFAGAGGREDDDRAGRRGDGAGALYVLETFRCPGAAPCFPVPNSGQVVRLERNGTRQVIVTGLNFPTTLRLGPDGALYVSNNGYGSAPGSGQVLRIPISAQANDDDKD
jgi:hypothetical protein